MSWPFLYVAGERLSRAELTSARLDGDVVEVGDAYIPADAVETRELRAASLRAVIPDALAVTRESAAWVHGAISAAPARHTVQRLSAARVSQVVSARLVYRDQPLPPDGVMRIAGLAVTSPAHTLADLVRAHHAGEPVESCIDALLAWRPGIASDALGVLERSASVHHKRAALARLRALTSSERTSERGDPDQDDVTRYTS